MESLQNYLAENASAIWTTIVTFFSVYGVALVSLVVGIIRTKLAAIKANEASTERMNKIIDDFTKKLDEMEKAVIEASNVNTDKRIKAMQEIADTVNAANDALQEADPVDTTNANDALDALE